MIETVLESFCERCGTRYTFTEQEPTSESGRPKLGRLGRRTSAASAVEPAIATTLPTSERFAGTFHFCLECRQYACGDCWNSQAGSCVGCRPLGDADQEPPTASIGAASIATGRAGAPSKPTAWPTGDLDRPTTAAPDGHVHANVDQPADPGADMGTAGGSQAPWKAATDHGVATPSPSELYPSGRTVFDHPAGVVDEWGRPIAVQATKQSPSIAPDLPFDPSRPTADPWQGVVFSERGGRAGGQAPPPLEAAQDEAPSSPAREHPTVAPPEIPVAGQAALASAVWPENDKGQGSAVTAATARLISDAAWPEVDRRGQVSLDRDEPEPVAVAEIVAVEPAAEPVAVAEIVAVEPAPEPPSAAQRILGIGAVAVGAVAVGEAGPSPELFEPYPATLLPEEAAAPQVPPALAAEAGPDAVVAPPVLASATLSFVEPDDIETTSPPTSAQPMPPPMAEPTPKPDIAPAPLAPIPTPMTPAPLGPVTPVAGPFAQPYQQPPAAPQLPPMPQPVEAFPTAAPGPQHPSAQPPSNLPPTPLARPAVPVAPPPMPLVPPPAQPRPSFMIPPPASMAAPSIPPTPTAVQRTASQACASCGLPLSAKARFCRRCGAAQP